MRLTKQNNFNRGSAKNDEQFEKGSAELAKRTDFGVLLSFVFLRVWHDTTQFTGAVLGPSLANCAIARSKLFAEYPCHKVAGML